MDRLQGTAGVKMVYGEPIEPKEKKLFQYQKLLMVLALDLEVISK
jgi:uncharacterized spore protein YtfJ